MMFGRRESHVIIGFYFGEIKENMHDFACQWKGDKTKNKQMTITHKNHGCERRNHGLRHEEHKPVGNNLGLNFHSHLADTEIFQTEGKFYECNLVKKSINSTFSVLPFQRVTAIGQGSIFNMYGNDFRHPSILK